jgi:hypothetical protein
MGNTNTIKAELGDYTILIGDKFDDSRAVYQKDDNGVLTPYSLAGKTIRTEVRATKDGDVVLSMVSPTDITISGDDDEIYTYDKVITELSEGKYYYDTQIDEDDYTIRSGKMIAKAQITDD